MISWLILMRLSWRDINLHNDIANTALQHLFKFSSSYKIMKGGSCINFSVESSLQLQVNHGTRWARHPQESAFGKFGVPKYLSPDSRKGRSRGWFSPRGGGREGEDGYPYTQATATSCIYQPTSAVSFLRDSRLRYPAGNTHQLGDSQECDWASPRKRVLC